MAGEIRGAGPRVRARVLGAALAAAAALGACDRGTPLQPAAALPPDGPARLLHPLCTGGGGQTHAGGSITTAVTWPASGNPHRVTGTVTLSTGGTLTVAAGAIVCFDAGTGVQSYGGRLVAQGTAAAPIVLTARDPVYGWNGITLNSEPPSPSLLTNVRIEDVHLYSIAVSSYFHPVVIDSAVIRQSGQAVLLQGRSSRLSRSRVDTTTDASGPAVLLGDSVRVEQTTIRGAAGTGLYVGGGAGVHLLGVRVEGSGDVGLQVPNPGAIASADPVRVVGSSSYGAWLHVAAMAKLYPGLADQDSLVGNGRDTLVVTGGALNAPVYARAILPWHVMETLQVGANGVLYGQPGALFVFHQGTGIRASGGGRVRLRGWRPAAVVLTADDPALGWTGIALEGTPSAESWLTNVRVEHVQVDSTAVAAYAGHPVVIDSAVFRQNGQAVALRSQGSRLSRSRVDTTRTSQAPAVILASDAVMESTRVRASSGEGVSIRGAAVQVLSCEVLNSVEEGIIMGIGATVDVHNCNLVGNGMAGINNKDTATTASATGNWWGDAGGPTAPSGDGVAGLVTYGPWLTAPYTLPYVP
ncbi:MAG TPA: right-handed parallel beta-helix repeat-containing protein [Longimicrobium sp.]|uniref:right-handed parallel beta-helix repeat-containing protein n=1 Tax=Longimicrobium sp. TaxID=2029185 RepID=UPI002ED7935A